MLCYVIQVYSLDYAPRWYHSQVDRPTKDKGLIPYVVLDDVSIKPISPGNIPPVGYDSESAMKNNTMKVSDKPHSFIFNEIFCCSFIEEKEQQQEGWLYLVSDDSSDEDDMNGDNKSELNYVLIKFIKIIYDIIKLTV